MEVKWINTDKNINVDSCVFAITDYLTNSPLDNKLIEQLSYYYKKLYFFPQGAEDTQYLQQLPAYTQYKENISILPRDINLLKIFLTEILITLELGYIWVFIAFRIIFHL